MKKEEKKIEMWKVRVAPVSPTFTVRFNVEACYI